jgi:hypothetical protein
MAEKAWLRFNGRFDAKIEAKAKESVAELRPRSSFRTTSIPTKWPSRLARRLCAARQLPTIQSASYRDPRAVARGPAWGRPRTTLCSYIVLAAAHPKRATEIIPLFSGNFAR